MENIVNNTNITNILILGVGGGCDIFSAYCYSKYLLSILNHEVKIIIGNTKRVNKDISNLKLISKHIYGLYPKSNIKNKLNKRMDIEHLPFSHDNIIIMLPQSDMIEECNELIEELQFEKWDLIISVDTGGDSICDDLSKKNKDNRDIEMIEILKSIVNKTNSLYYHIIYGLGSDGENNEIVISKSLNKFKDNRKYIGTYNITDEMYYILGQYSKYFDKNRTINILFNNSYNNKKYESICRGEKYIIPTIWLKQFIVLDYNI